jgi:D-methionine transport system ATP-binding protein
MIELKNLGKVYSNSGKPVTALEDINLTINDGEIFGIIGLSGAGKSTLVRCINLLEKPTSGQVLIDGRNLTELSQKELLLTRRSIGMIFQGFNLLEQRTVLKNVCFPLEIAGTPRAESVKRAEELLGIVGLEDKKNAYPSQLSGGQKQRVAIARALATNPRYLLCDEATSALDPNTTRSILELLRQINDTLGVTIVVITHEMRVIDTICDRVAVIDQSRIAEEGKVSEVFANPQSDIAKQLILRKESSEGAFKNFSGKKLRLVFDGLTSEKPLIAEMVLACQAPVSIMSADMRNYDGTAYGYTIIELPDDQRQADKIHAWLAASPIKVYEED